MRCSLIYHIVALIVVLSLSADKTTTVPPFMKRRHKIGRKMNQPLLNILEEAVYTAGDINFFFN